jgi:hypothetical protein
MLNRSGQILQHEATVLQKIVACKLVHLPASKQLAKLVLAFKMQQQNLMDFNPLLTPIHIVTPLFSLFHKNIMVISHLC